MIRQILHGLWPPLVVAVPLLALAWWSRSPGRVARSCRSWACAVSMAAGLVAAFVALESLPPAPWNTVGARGWLVWGTVAAGIVGLVDGVGRWPERAWRVAVLVLPTAVAWLAFRQVTANAWTVTENVLHVAATGLAAAAITGLASGPTQRPGVLVPVQLTAIAAATGHVLGNGGSGFLGQLAGAVTAVCGVCAVMALRNPEMVMGRGAALVFGVSITLLLAMGWHLAEVPVAAIALCALAPLALHVPRMMPRAAWSLRTAVTLAVTVMPLAAAAVIVSVVRGDSSYGY